jgi:WD40 repeat protein
MEIILNGHTSAVRALSWLAGKPAILVSGGGYNDKSIKIWDVKSSTQLSSLKTCSQVCSLLSSASSDQLLTTHGFPHNHIILWKFPEMKKISRFDGHSSRVLFVSLAPDGETVVTGAADEKLKFWKVFRRRMDNRKESQLTTKIHLLR